MDGPGGTGSLPPRLTGERGPATTRIGWGTGLALAALGVAIFFTVLQLVPSSGEAPVPPLAAADPSPGTHAGTDPAQPPDPTPIRPPALDLPFVSGAAHRSTHHHLEAGAPSPASTRSTATAAAELRILNDALDALRTDPQKTLTLCDDHAKRYATSPLAQDRESLAVRALLALGRTDDAKKRAEAFQKAFPDSPLEGEIEEALASP
jgi:hypothetical protein